MPPRQKCPSFFLRIKFGEIFVHFWGTFSENPQNFCARYARENSALYFLSKGGSHKNFPCQQTRGTLEFAPSEQALAHPQQKVCVRACFPFSICHKKLFKWDSRLLHVISILPIGLYAMGKFLTKFWTILAALRGIFPVNCKKKSRSLRSRGVN